MQSIAIYITIWIEIKSSLGYLNSRSPKLIKITNCINVPEPIKI